MKQFSVRDFLGSFPLWFLMQDPQSGLGGASTHSDGVVAVKIAGVAALAVFTEEDLAEQYGARTEISSKGYALARFDEPDRMIAFLREQSNGITHLTFDPTPDGRARTPFTVGECIAAFQAIGE
jgi:hypothetical protein